MCTQYIRRIFALLTLVLAFHANGLPGESITLNPSTGNYTVVYFGYDASGASDERTTQKIVSFEPATKIVPAVKSFFELEASGVVAYRFQVRNGLASKQSLDMFLIDPVSSLISSNQLGQMGKKVSSDGAAENYGIASYPIKSPVGWIGRVTESKSGGLRFGWSSTEDGLPVGERQKGMGFFSLDLPGIGVAKLHGNAGITAWPDEGPVGEIGDEMDRLIQNDFVPYNVAAPLIAVPIPFDPATVLENLRTHVATWPSKQLADAAFASELDRNLQAAANAYRTGQTQEAREYIEILFGAIRRDHKDIDREDDDEEHDGKRGDKDDRQKANTQRLSIDRLAARVLDFDLKYVLKRVKEEGKDRDGKERDGREHKKER